MVAASPGDFAAGVQHAGFARLGLGKIKLSGDSFLFIGQRF
jgi:hypothetical protein